MDSFIHLTKLKPYSTILDLGGTPEIWQFVDIPLNITLLNLPGHIPKPDKTHHNFVYVEGDACAVECFSDGEFDLVFSNSVIEHVGDNNKVREFAREVTRLGKSYWVQTPSRWFPMEVHCGMPFWWFYPHSLQRWLLAKWRRDTRQNLLPPGWVDMVESTRAITLPHLRKLFPQARIQIEFSFGFPKSYIVHHLSNAAMTSLTSCAAEIHAPLRKSHV